MKSVKPSSFLILFIIVFNVTMSVYVTPVTDHGDAQSYIMLSKVFLGQENADLSHRSPLFSMIMAIFIFIADEPAAFQLVVFYHYLLIGLSTWLIFVLFSSVHSGKRLPVLTAIMFNVSLSTLYYANIMLTEISTVALLLTAVIFLYRFHQHSTTLNAFMIGFAIGLLVLVRFNTTPLVFTFLFLLVLSLIMQRQPLPKAFLRVLIFLISYALVLNSWLYYNYKVNDFYGLFPNASKVAMSSSLGNAVVATIHSGNVVPPEQQPILDIYLEAIQEYENQHIGRMHGSLSGFDFLGLLDNLYRGYPIRQKAMGKIRVYLDEAENERDYLEKRMAISNFNKVIKKQNRKQITMLRFASLFSSLRASSNALPEKYGNLNTNILPGFVIQLYKIFFFAISITVFFSFFIFLFRIKRNKFRFDFMIFTFFAIVFSFYFINFYFITVNDANRFKFPAEPFVFGLFIYLSSHVYLRLIDRKFKRYFK